MKKLFVSILLAISLTGFAQLRQNIDSLRNIYFAEQKVVSSQFGADYYPNLAKIYALNERSFLQKIDSLKAPFDIALAKYKVDGQLIDAKFIEDEHRDINYFFDRMILDYPYFHKNYTGNNAVLSASTQKKLSQHIPDFNKPDLLNSRDVKNYVEGFLRHKSSVEVKKATYKKSDNKRLDAYLNLIPRYFSNQACRDYWQYYFINTYLEECGSKHLEIAVNTFLSGCKNETYKHIVDSAYTESLNGLKGHLIKTYKTVDGYSLDLHIFLPDSIKDNKKRPVIVYFSGGSWTMGNPEWAFYGCANDAKRGWVSVSVEYRLADRHESTPFEAVKDARTAIRWLRANAEAYSIDTNRIIASGNSAGGHLVLCTAMSNEWNESTDDLRFNASPNLLLVNSGVYNLYAEDATDWIIRDLKDKTLAKKISPLHLIRKGLPPMLILHGTNDRSVDYSSAKIFAEEMKKFSNDVEFDTLEGAPHYIWFDRRFSSKVAALRKDFLRRYGYE